MALEKIFIWYFSLTSPWPCLPLTLPSPWPRHHLDLDIPYLGITLTLIILPWHSLYFDITLTLILPWPWYHLPWHHLDLDIPYLGITLTLISLTLAFPWAWYYLNPTMFTCLHVHQLSSVVKYLLFIIPRFFFPICFKVAIRFFIISTKWCF